MKLIRVHLHGAAKVSDYMFRDHALADAGYQKIKDALAAYREFANDKDQIVSVPGDDGAEFTLKLHHASAVACEDPYSSTDLAMEYLSRIGAQERTFRKAAGLKIETDAQ